jgi:DNA-binding PadR family transcriptional regulator
MEEARELTRRETNMLLALAVGPMSGYMIVRQCREDSMGEVALSNGTVFPALRRLFELGAVEQVKAETGRASKHYRLTRKGRQLLEWELATYRRLVRLGQERI